MERLPNETNAAYAARVQRATWGLQFKNQRFAAVVADMAPADIPVQPVVSKGNVVDMAAFVALRKNG